MKVETARSSEGIFLSDLLRMSFCLKTELVELLSQVEKDGIWPEQMLEALVAAVPKNDGAKSPNEFRPIVLLSLVYRAWSGLSKSSNSYVLTSRMESSASVQDSQRQMK